MVQVLALPRRQPRSIKVAMRPSPGQPRAQPALPYGLEPGAGRTGRALFEDIRAGVGEPVDLGALPLEVEGDFARACAEDLGFELGRGGGEGELAALDHVIVRRCGQEHAGRLIGPFRGTELRDEEPAEGGEGSEENDGVEDDLERLHGCQDTPAKPIIDRAGKRAIGIGLGLDWDWEGAERRRLLTL